MALRRCRRSRRASRTRLGIWLRRGTEPAYRCTHQIGPSLARRPRSRVAWSTVSGRTQAALYAEIDHELSWSERDLPQRLRTKHVHRLHPYLGKFVPQLAETLLRRSLAPGAVVYDPFAGSGTTLVEANALGIHAIGADVSAFNCLLMRVKVARHDLTALRRDLDRALDAPSVDPPRSEWL